MELISKNSDFRKFVKFVEQVLELFDLVAHRINLNPELNDASLLWYKTIDEHKAMWELIYNKLTHRLVGKEPRWINKQKAHEVNQEARRLYDIYKEYSATSTSRLDITLTFIIKDFNSYEDGGKTERDKARLVTKIRKMFRESSEEIIPLFR